MQLDPPSVPISKGNKRLIFAFSALVALGVTAVIAFTIFVRVLPDERPIAELAPLTSRLPADVDVVGAVASPAAVARLGSIVWTDDVREAIGEEDEELSRLGLFDFARSIPVKLTEPAVFAIDSVLTPQWLYVVASARGQNAASTLQTALVRETGLGPVERDGDVFFMAESAATVQDGQLYVVVRQEDGPVGASEEAPVAVLRRWLDGPTFDPAGYGSALDDLTPVLGTLAYVNNVGDEVDPDMTFVISLSLRGDDELTLWAQYDNLTDTFFADVGAAPGPHADLDNLPRGASAVAGFRVDVGAYLDEVPDYGVIAASVGFTEEDLRTKLSGAFVAATNDLSSFRTPSPTFTFAAGVNDPESADALVAGRAATLNALGFSATDAEVNGEAGIVVTEGELELRVSTPELQLVVDSSVGGELGPSHPLLDEGFGDQEAVGVVWLDLHRTAGFVVQLAEEMGAFPEGMPEFDLTRLQRERASVLARVYAGGTSMKIRVDLEGATALIETVADVVSWFTLGDGKDLGF